MNLTIPAAWLEALREVQKVCPSAVIAGGALRDLAFGGYPKDLDIFVPSEEVRAHPGHMKPAEWNMKSLLLTQEYQVGMRDVVVAVSEWDVKYLVLPVQIIELAAPAGEGFGYTAVQRMDFDSCRVFHTGHRLVTTHEFRSAHEHCRWTLLLCEDEKQAARSLRRAERFAVRYPHVTFDLGLAHHRIALGHLEGASA